MTARKHDGHSTILVMSTNGRSRPVTVVACYLMYVNKMSVQDALAFIKLKRKAANPNANFIS
jgi:protein-tyrosine phosphatase